MLRTSHEPWWTCDSQTKGCVRGVHLVRDVYGHTQVSFTHGVIEIS